MALFAGAVLVSAFTILQQVDPFDEGLVLQAARRVAQGQLPYGDFQWAYGPAQPYLLAALFKLFGTSLLQWRILRSLCDAAVATLVFALARREVGTRWAILAWLAVAGEMAEPRSANPFPYALACVLGAALVAARGRAVVAGVLIAAAAAFRLDFALYGAAAIAVCLAFLPAPGRVRSVARFAGVAAGLTLLAYMPFLVQIGPSRLYHAVFGTSLNQGSYWTLPFPLHYHGSLSGLKGFKHAIDFYVPALLVVGLALAGKYSLELVWYGQKK